MDRQQMLVEIGKSYADGLFHEFVENPGYRGPNFSWDEFPDTTVRLATASAFQHFPDSEVITQEDEDVVAEAARATTNKLIKQHFPTN